MELRVELTENDLRDMVKKRVQHQFSLNADKVETAKLSFHTNREAIKFDGYIGCVFTVDL